MAEFTFGFNIKKDRRIADSLSDLVGNTPLMKMSRFSAKNNLKGNIIAKLEYFNPLGSSKDRVGIAMIENAEKDGTLKKGSVIIEPTSGNTGIGLAMASTVKGYKLILTMPENMSAERVKLLTALGAEIVLTPKEDGMTGAVNKAKELASQYENSFIPGQFENPANPQIHRVTTAQEILRDTYGNIDYFVAGVGTGGTITGVAEVLKAYNKNIKIIAVEPADSPLLSEGRAAPHKLQGIGANFIPEILNREIIDEIIPVTTEQAYSAVHSAAKTEGLLIGISGGAALYAASVIAKKEENKNKNIIVLLPDSGERYLSTDLFD